MANESLGNGLRGHSIRRKATVDFLLSALIKEHSPKLRQQLLDVEHTIKTIALCNNGDDLEFFKRIEGICRELINSDCQTTKTVASSILLNDIAIYYESVGLFSKAFEMHYEALASAIEEGNTALERRAHSRLAIMHTRFCEFNSACEHIEMAYQLANKEGSAFYAFAALVNAVPALEAMGLYHEACALALKIANQPKSDKYFSHLHLINANNGIRICHIILDMTKAEMFSKISKREIKKCECLVNQVTRAYYDVSQIAHTLRKGFVGEALGMVESIESQYRVINNIKVRALFYCVKAEVCMALKDEGRIIECCKDLDALLDESRTSFTHYEEILRVLIQVYSEGNGKILNCRMRHLKYLILLREHVVSVKHRVFFSNNAPIFENNNQSSEILTNPKYQIPSWMMEVIRGKPDKIEAYGLIDESFPEQLDVLPTALAKVAGEGLELALRSPRYNIAENWSVAADFASGFDGRHCFRVGRLSRAIAVKLGMSFRNALIIELACRLHDIGNVAFVFVPKEQKPLRAFGQFSIFCEHTSFGAKILESSSEEVLISGAVVAQSHHEWWNGCGYPLGLRGREIPVEGRICAVAEALILLIRPPINGQDAWTIPEAMEQVNTMAGLQFDPELVSLLSDLLEGGPLGASTLAIDGIECEHM